MVKQVIGIVLTVISLVILFVIFCLGKIITSLRLRHNQLCDLEATFDSDDESSDDTSFDDTSSETDISLSLQHHDIQCTCMSVSEIERQLHPSELYSLHQHWVPLHYDCEEHGKPGGIVMVPLRRMMFAKG